MTANPVPNTFTNGTTADATQVNANFSSVISDLNNIDGGQITTGTLGSGRVSASNITSGTLPAAQLPVPGSGHATPANPTGTTSSSLVMMGAGSTITPARSGTVLFIISGDIANSVGGTAGFTYQIRYGTGSAPANGAAVTGTAASAQAPNVPPGTNAVPFSTQGIVTGLTRGTAYWFDIALAVFGGGGGTASVTNLTVDALEV